MKTLLILLFTIIPFFTQSQNIELTIKGITSNEGSFLVGVFLDEESFRKEIPIKEFNFSKKDQKDGELKANLTLEKGTFGLSLLDDKNNNKKMDFNFFGIPKEGYGFSNFYHRGWKRPRFEDFKFYCNGVEKQKIEIIVKYF